MNAEATLEKISQDLERELHLRELMIEMARSQEEAHENYLYACQEVWAYQHINLFEVSGSSEWIARFAHIYNEALRKMGVRLA